MAHYDFFENKKVSPLGQWLGKIHYKKLLQSIQKSLPHDALVIEIGAGHSQIPYLIKEQGSINYKAYEPSQALYDMLRHKGISVCQDFVPPLHEASQSVDCIVMNHVLEHIPGNSVWPLFEEFKRVIKPSGKIIIITPDILDFGGDFWDSDYTHVFPTSMNRLQQISRDAGLDVHHAKYIFGSLEVFPGWFCNCAVKMFFSLCDFPYSILSPKKPKINKLRTMFRRAVWLELKAKA